MEQHAMSERSYYWYCCAWCVSVFCKDAQLEWDRAVASDAVRQGVVFA